MCFDRDIIRELITYETYSLFTLIWEVIMYTHIMSSLSDTDSTNVSESE